MSRPEFALIANGFTRHKEKRVRLARLLEEMWTSGRQAGLDEASDRLVDAIQGRNEKPKRTGHEFCTNPELRMHAMVKLKATAAHRAALAAEREAVITMLEDAEDIAALQDGVEIGGPTVTLDEVLAKHGLSRAALHR